MTEGSEQIPSPNAVGTGCSAGGVRVARDGCGYIHEKCISDALGDGKTSSVGGWYGFPHGSDNYAGGFLAGGVGAAAVLSGGYSFECGHCRLVLFAPTRQRGAAAGALSQAGVVGGGRAAVGEPDLVDLAFSGPLRAGCFGDKIVMGGGGGVGGI